MPTKPVTDISQLDPNAVYSYADYMTWQFDQMVELIKGKLMPMSPAPKLKHQAISRQLTMCLGTYFKNHKCKLFVAPFDVRLYDRRKSEQSDKESFTVVQPDLCVVCDPSKLDENGCKGAPDLVIEILSKGNSKREMRTKYDLYEECGVMEYWVVDPERENMQQFILDDKGKYQSRRIYVSDETADSPQFPGLSVSMVEVFED